MAMEKAEIERARDAQHYVARAPACRDCQLIEYDVEYVRGTRPWNQYESYPMRSNAHCGVGGFPVSPSAFCKLHQPKPV